MSSNNNSSIVTSFTTTVEEAHARARENYLRRFPETAAFLTRNARQVEELRRHRAEEKAAEQSAAKGEGLSLAQRRNIRAAMEASQR